MILLCPVAPGTTMNYCRQDESQYMVTVRDDGNGHASASVDGRAAAKVTEGTIVTLTAIPSEGYKFEQWTVVSGGVTLEPNASTNSVAFTMPADNVVIEAGFAPVPAP